MDNYIEVSVLEYVKQGLQNGSMQPIQAEKFARIIARQGVVGEEVVTWSIDDLGNAIVEKTANVKEDEMTGKPAWVVTKTSEDGNPIVDNNGNLNQWIIDDATFTKKYEIDPQNPQLFKPKGGTQIFVQIADNIILEQWGSKMQIASGGWINITNIDDMYGISARDFEDTYKITSDQDTKGTK